MPPNVFVLLPLAGVLLGLASSFVVINLRPASKAYSRASYPMVMGFDLKLALLLTLMAMVVVMLACAGYPLLRTTAVIDRPVIPNRTIPIDSLVHLMPPPPPLDPDKAGQLWDYKVPSKAPTLGIPRPVPDDQAVPDDDMTADQALRLYAQNTALSDSALKGLLPVADGDLPKPGDYVAYDRAPCPVALVKPVYPLVCVNLKIEGTAFVQMLVAKSGQVVRVLVIRSSGDVALDEAAAEAARNCRFTPAMQGNAPVSVWISMPFDFRLAK